MTISESHDFIPSSMNQGDPLPHVPSIPMAPRAAGSGLAWFSWLRSTLAKQETDIESSRLRHRNESHDARSGRLQKLNPVTDNMLMQQHAFAAMSPLSMADPIGEGLVVSAGSGGGKDTIKMAIEVLEHLSGNKIEKTALGGGKFKLNFARGAKAKGTKESKAFFEALKDLFDSLTRVEIEADWDSGIRIDNLDQKTVDFRDIMAINVQRGKEWGETSEGALIHLLSEFSEAVDNGYHGEADPVERRKKQGKAYDKGKKAQNAYREKIGMATDVVETQGFARTPKKNRGRGTRTHADRVADAFPNVRVEFTDMYETSFKPRGKKNAVLLYEAKLYTGGFDPRPGRPVKSLYYTQGKDGSIRPIK